MERNTLDKVLEGKVQPYDDDVAEEVVEEKTLPTTRLSKTWLRSLLLTVETSGIQRVTEEERRQNTSKVWNACTFWYVDTTLPKMIQC
jgi:hypothetical protein